MSSCGCSSSQTLSSGDSWSFSHRLKWTGPSLLILRGTLQAKKKQKRVGEIEGLLGQSQTTHLECKVLGYYCLLLCKSSENFNQDRRLHLCNAAIESVSGPLVHITFNFLAIVSIVLPRSTVSLHMRGKISKKETRNFLKSYSHERLNE